MDRDYLKAKEHALEAIGFQRDDPSLLAETLRGLMLDHSHLSDHKGFLMYEKEARYAINAGTIKTPMDVATILEGIGKSKTHFGDIGAINEIQDAEKEMLKLNKFKRNRPLRYLQIHRSRLRLLSKNEITRA